MHVGFPQGIQRVVPPNARCLYKGPAPRCSNRSARAGAAPEGSPPTRAVGTLSAQGRAITTHSNVYVIHQNEVVALHHYGFGGDAMGRGTHNSGVRASLIKSALAGIGL